MLADINKFNNYLFVCLSGHVTSCSIVVVVVVVVVVVIYLQLHFLQLPGSSLPLESNPLTLHEVQDPGYVVVNLRAYGGYLSVQGHGDPAKTNWNIHPELS